MRSKLRRAVRHVKIIGGGHLLNNPFRNREHRKRVRDRVTLAATVKYLQQYVPQIRSIVPDSLPGSEQPKERVFTMWLQGEDNAPALVKACISSMRRHLAQEVVVITEKNLSEWITLPEHIMEKWRNGKIRAAHFSDICRVELLWNYGGIWLDSTAYVTSPVPDEIMEADFFVYLAGSKIGGSYAFMQNCFIRSRRHHPLLGVWRGAIHSYWEKEESIVDYYTHQILFKLAVENNAVANKQFALMLHKDQDPTHRVWREYRDKPFDPELFDRLTKDSFFQKTNYKSKECLNPAEGTFAYYLINDLT